MLPDMNYLVKQIKPQTKPLRMRQANVVSVEADNTMTVRIAGDETGTLAKVKYLSTVTPLPGYSVWVITDGTDMVGIGHVGNEGKTLAPTAYISTNESVPKNTEHYLSFDNVRNDAWNCWDVTHPTRLTAPLTGYYQSTAVIYIQDASNVALSIGIRLNGTQAICRQDVTLKSTTDDFHGMVTSTPFHMTKGDYLEMMVKHDNNNPLNLQTTGHGYSHIGYYNCLSFIYLGT